MVGEQVFSVDERRFYELTTCICGPVEDKIPNLELLDWICPQNPIKLKVQSWPLHFVGSDCSLVIVQLLCEACGYSWSLLVVTKEVCDKDLQQILSSWTAFADYKLYIRLKNHRLWLWTYIVCCLAACLPPCISEFCGTHTTDVDETKPLQTINCRWRKDATHLQKQMWSWPLIKLLL